MEGFDWTTENTGGLMVRANAAPVEFRTDHRAPSLFHTRFRSDRPRCGGRESGFKEPWQEIFPRSLLRNRDVWLVGKIDFQEVLGVCRPAPLLEQPVAEELLPFADHEIPLAGSSIFMELRSVNSTDR